MLSAFFSQGYNEHSSLISALFVYLAVPSQEEMPIALVVMFHGGKQPFLHHTCLAVPGHVVSAVRLIHVGGVGNLARSSVDWIVD
jgi:hypothetical protein